MAQTTSDRLQNTLKNLQSRLPDVEGVAVASSDGLVMAAHLPSGIEEDRIGAMGAAILAIGIRSSSELNRGETEQVYVKGESGYVMLMNIGNDAVLITVTSENAKLGLLFLELKRTIADLQKVL